MLSFRDGGDLSLVATARCMGVYLATRTERSLAAKITLLMRCGRYEGIVTLHLC